MNAKKESYREHVDLVAEVCAASVARSGGGSFTIRLEDGSQVEGTFEGHQESAVTEALHRHETMRLHVQGEAEFDRAGHIARITRMDAADVRPAPGGDTTQPRKRYWEVFREASDGIPDEEWADLPTDLSKNLDHYLYGHDKAE